MRVFTEHLKSVGQAGGKQIDDYLDRLETCLSDLPPEQARLLTATAEAQIELEIELEPHANDADVINNVFRRLGEPAQYARQLRETLAVSPPVSQNGVAPTVADTVAGTEEAVNVAPCRHCGKLVSREAWVCPHCGAPRPVIAAYVRQVGGYEWKSKATLFGWPLVHVAVGRGKNGRPRVAKGIIAIGQYGIGVITIAQFGIGFLFGLGQFMLAPISIGQFALGLAAIGQFGIGLLYGVGQIATGLTAIGQITHQWFHGR